MINITTTVVHDKVYFHCDQLSQQEREALENRLIEFRVPHECRFNGKTIVVSGDNYVDYQMVLNAILFLVTDKINKQLEPHIKTKPT